MGMMGNTLGTSVYHGDWRETQPADTKTDGGPMAEKLQQGDRFPQLTLKLVGGGTIRIPDEAPSRYTAVLFYRGHW